MLWGANHVIPSGFCLSRIIFYNPAIPSGLVFTQNMSGNLLLALSSAQGLPYKRRRGRRLEHKLMTTFARALGIVTA